MEALVGGGTFGERRGRRHCAGCPLAPFGLGEPISDKATLRRFIELYDESHSVQSPNDNADVAHRRERLAVFDPAGEGSRGLSFDVAAGEKELLARRVGQNELDTIQVCLGYVGAQEDYLAMNPDGSSVPHYADRLFSSPGTRNGLYWKRSRVSRTARWGRR